MPAAPQIHAGGGSHYLPSPFHSYHGMVSAEMVTSIANSPAFLLSSAHAAFSHPVYLSLLNSVEVSFIGA
jgi:hypothetical protein